MERSFLLRVYSVKEERDGPHEPHNPHAQTWEVRADGDAGTPRASVFYEEQSERDLPRVGQLIRVRLDEQLTVEEAYPPAGDPD